MILELEKQVCSLESAKRLKELGVKQESLFYWYKRECKLSKGFHLIGCGNSVMTIHGSLCFKPDNNDIVYSAYTVAELGELLPEDCYTIKRIKRSSIDVGFYCKSIGNDSYTQFQKTEAESRAKMICYLLENKLI